MSATRRQRGLDARGTCPKEKWLRSSAISRLLGGAPAQPAAGAGGPEPGRAGCDWRGGQGHPREARRKGNISALRSVLLDTENG